MSVLARFKNYFKFVRSMRDLDQNTWRAQLASDRDAVVLDVRTPSECAQGIIPGAEMLDIMSGPVFMSRLASFDKSKNYYVYCRSGARSAQACGLMEAEGLTCYNLQGGISQWNGEVVTPQR